jgi:glycosyltransferase involved in cell wall biosynthesis
MPRPDFVPGATRSDSSGRVILASNVSHSVHAAMALHGLGVLRRYIGPVLIDKDCVVGRHAPRRINSRVVPNLNRLPLTRLVGSEIFMRFSSSLPGPRSTYVSTRAAILDRAISRRLNEADVVHINTTALVRSTRRAKALGAFVIADHRGLHPRAVPHRDPLLLGLEIELKEADWVLASSHYSAQSLATYGIDPKKIAVIPLGVDLVRFTPGQTPLARPRQVVLFVGSITHHKGVHLLLDVASRTANANIDFRLCGPIVDPTLARRAAALQNVEILGPKTGDHVVTEYQHADVMVLPTRFDAFGLVVPEALACGTPVVTTTACGSAALVSRHHAGTVCAPDDSLALNSAVQGVLARGRDGFALACAAAAQDASWDRYRERLQQWYRQVVLPSIGVQP